MTEGTIERKALGLRANGLVGTTIGVLIVVALLLKLRLVFTLNINWDEFYYLDSVHIYRRGELALQLQTFHVHFFTWLADISANEADQIVAARLVIYVLGLGSSALTYSIARDFLDRNSALFAVGCYLSFSFVVEHGASFRADPIAAFLFLGAVCLLIRSSQSWFASIAAGVAVALALMVTMKSLFYLPLFAAILSVRLARREVRGTALRDLGGFGGSLVVGFAVIFLLHRATLAAPAFDAAASLIERSAEKVIRLDELFPRRIFLFRSFVEDGILWLILFGGAALLLARAIRDRSRQSRDRLLMLLFLLPLATLAFYRNAFPYYYVFILSPAVVLCGVAFQHVSSRDGAGRRSPILAFVLALVVFGSMSRGYLSNMADRIQPQREIIELAHRLFPEPVAYIDRTTMVASYPKVGFFMSTWGMEQYRDLGRPIFRDAIVKQRPLFLIANSRSLEPDGDQDWLRAAGVALFAEDHAVLRENYVHHWGDLYVAGKKLRLSEGGQSVEFEILIPGRYTLETTTAVEIDGAPVPPGGTVDLGAGAHRARTLSNAGQEVILRWGERLYRPNAPTPRGRLFIGF